MKLNWTTLKVIFMFAIVAIALVWVVSITRPTTYSGENLSFGVLEGAVTITNPSESPILAKLTGTGSRSFRLASTTDGLSGSSIRQLNTQTFDYLIPAGISEFSIVRGIDVQFATSTGTILQAVVNPFPKDRVQSLVILVLIVSAVALYYASHITHHRWIGILRGQPAPTPITPVDESMAGGQGRAARAYGDNHVE